jgi:hypothetical protein
MLHDPDSNPKLSQRHTKKSSPSKKNSSQLKLVASNPPPQKSPSPSRPLTSKSGFSVDVKKIGCTLYEMYIRDQPHDLECDLTLELEGSSGTTLSKTVICHLPNILKEDNKLLNEEELLYGQIMIQFQMKILEQLLLFCARFCASYLVIYMDDDQAEGFGIYQDFLISQDPTLTENGEKTEMVIPADKETLADWRNFMAEATLSFEQELWREQRFNPVIRQYLKSQIQKGTLH